MEIVLTIIGLGMAGMLGVLAVLQVCVVLFFIVGFAMWIAWVPLCGRRRYLANIENEQRKNALLFLGGKEMYNGEYECDFGMEEE